MVLHKIPENEGIMRFSLPTSAWLLQKRAIKATKFLGNDQVVTPLFPYLLNKVNDSSLRLK